MTKIDTLLSPQLTSELEDILKVKFNDKSRLVQALIHRSYLNENKDYSLESNERYEFLGDAVLELWISDYLFSHFPKMKEGDMTNLRAMLVRTESLAQIAKENRINQYILLSRGEETHGGKENLSILADTTESLIGAIFLDQGYQAVDSFLSMIFAQSIKDLSSQKIFKDPKSIFQEIAQAKSGVTPHYETVNESGPDHNKTYKVAVFVGDKLIATGMGHSKQKAEEDASIKATKKFTNPV